MKDKKALTKAFTMMYTIAIKSDKVKLLNQFTELTGYNRSYAATILRNFSETRKKRKKYSRKPYYDEAVRKTLEKIWYIMDCICGQRLAPILPEIVNRLEYFGEISIGQETKEKLCKISSATIDRLLTSVKAVRGRKNRSYTTPGNFLKKQIPIRTYGEWPDCIPGYIEVDLVSHEGGDNSGHFFWTLNATDIYSCWTTSVILEGKTQEDVLGGLKYVVGNLPFVLLGLDSDNGSEFINQLIVNFCEENNISFTRSRPYKKNDNCFVEQKNYSVVRRNVGYLRYDTPEELQVIKDLYTNLNLYNNFFLPVKKLLVKTRHGSTYTRKYQSPKTPYQRLQESESMTDNEKAMLKKQYLKMNPAALKRKIDSLQDKLIEITRNKSETVRRFLDKQSKNKLAHYRKRNKPAKNNPSIFGEKQRLDYYRQIINILDEIRK